MMKFFRDEITGDVFAFEADGSQDDYIRPGLVEMTTEEVEQHRNPAVVLDGAQVDAERDRRIAAGFVFNEVLFQTERQADRENILGAAYASLAAIVGGAQPGDLRWSDPDRDFFWIAADNSRVPMDAQTTQSFTMGAMSYKTKLIVACSNLKAMSPIPADFADDKWWP